MHHVKILAMCISLAITTGRGGGVLISPELPIDVSIPVEPEIDTTKELEEIVEHQAQYEKILKRKARIARKKREAYIYNIVANPNNVTITTGLEEDDYKYLTAGTWWAGNEWILADIEKRYGINAIFCMAVSTLESNYGTSRFAIEERNFYGLHTGIVYESLYASTLDWARRIRDYYLAEGRISVWTIGPKYCPLNRDWEVFMSGEMKSRRKQLIVNLQNTLN